MAVLNNIESAIKNYAAKDLQQALTNILIAVDATAKIEYPKLKETGTRYKQFLEDNRFLIQLIALNVRMENPIRFRNMHEWEKGTKPDTLSLAEIIYLYMRCKLLHEGELPASISFSEKAEIKLETDRMIFPENLVLALIVAVMTSPVHKDKKLSFDATLDIYGKKLHLSEIWGNKEKVKVTLI